MGLMRGGSRGHRRIILVGLSSDLAAGDATSAGDSGSYGEPRWFADLVGASDLHSGADFA